MVNFNTSGIALTHPINWGSWQAKGLVGLFAMSGTCCIERIRNWEASIGSAQPRNDQDGPDGYGPASRFGAVAGTSFNFSDPFITTFPYTIACWWKPLTNTFGTQYTGINISNGGLHSIHLGSFSSDAIDYTVVSNLNTAQSSGPTRAPNRWEFLAGRSSSSTSHQLFVNGVQAASSGSNVTPTGLNQLTLGRSVHSYGAKELAGGLAHACVWDRALSNAEIYALFDPCTRWDLYYPLQRRIYSFPGGAGGGGGFQAAWARGSNVLITPGVF